MLYLTVFGVMLLAAGGIVIKKTQKFAIIGIILAFVGAAMAVIMGVMLFRDDQSKTAKCASLDGHYGGGACYVQGVEKDLNNIEDFIKKDL